MAVKNEWCFYCDNSRYATCVLRIYDCTKLLFVCFNEDH